LLANASAACIAYRYRAHEFGDSILLDRQPILERWSGFL
jgi:S-adenosylmethionine:tRNA ribosyltransferase-isomerase